MEKNRGQLPEGAAATSTGGRMDHYNIYEKLSRVKA
jgi:hypothetical protein